MSNLANFILADSIHEEAEKIAAVIRKSLERKDCIIHLVTADMVLPGRVAAILEKWEIYCDDSRGLKVDQTPQARFMLQIAEAVEENFPPVKILALLRNKFFTAVPDVTRFANYLELNFYRGICTERNLQDLVNKFDDRNSGIAGEIVKLLQDRLPLKQGKGLDIIIEAHCAIAENISGGEIWKGEYGKVLHNALEQIINDCSGIIFKHGSYANLLENLLSQYEYRPSHYAHPRVKILSPMEARLLHADVTILAGLNEGVWPRSNTNPWMSRQMQLEFGLAPPETSIALSALDFRILTKKGEVYVTRSRKVDGSPTTPSRFVVKLESEMKSRGEWAQANKFSEYIDDIISSARIHVNVMPQPPLACPPVSARPRNISVSDLELWMQNPYGFYARKILGLKKLDDLDKEADSAEFGQLIHRILALFISSLPEIWPANADQLMRQAIENALSEAVIPRRQLVIWLPRLQAMINQFLLIERDRWPDILQAECEKQLEYNTDGLKVRIRSDRVDHLHDGRIRIIDYKTGNLPSISEIKRGEYCQLTLAALAVGRNLPFDLSYQKLVTTISKKERVELSEETAQAAIASAIQGVADLVLSYSNPSQTYICASGKNDDYRHLSRAAEWE